MGNPVRFTSGFTQDAKFQPLGLIGTPNPFFYAQYHDDYLGYIPARYTNTVNANGTIAQTAAAFGRILFTTNSSTPLVTDIASQQLDSAGFLLSLTKKTSYLTRLQLADVTNSALLVGMIQTTTTPFTVTDGIYFSKASGSTNLVVNVSVGSSIVATTTLTGLLTNATDIDLGFTYDGKGTLYIYAGAGLIGSSIRQNVIPLGPMGRLSITSLPSVLLNPTMAIQSGTASSKTMSVDLQFAAQER